jgi:hypothetical protein
MELMGHFADALDLKLVEIDSGLGLKERETGPGKVQTLFVSSQPRFSLHRKKTYVLRKSGDVLEWGKQWRA